MREIKFRGFHECKNGNTVIVVNGKEKRGEWVYGCLCCIDNEPVIVEGSMKWVDGSELYCNTFHFVIPESYGQYTGLKDKNGKEIYKGDIVELTNTYKGMNTKSIVEIDFIDFTFAGKWAEEYSPSGYMYNPLGSYNFPIVTIEVIGNIYENPELLGEHRKGDS